MKRKGDKSNCAWCGTSFTLTRSTQETCGNKSCSTMWSRKKKGGEIYPNFSNIRTPQVVQQSTYVQPAKLGYAYNHPVPYVNAINLPVNSIYKSVSDWFSGKSKISGNVGQIASDIVAQSIVFPLFDSFKNHLISSYTLKTEDAKINAAIAYHQDIIKQLNDGLFPWAKLGMVGMGYGVGSRIAPKEGVMSWLLPVAMAIAGYAAGHKVDKQREIKMSAADELGLRVQSHKAIEELKGFLQKNEQERGGIKTLLQQGILKEVSPGRYTASDTALEQIESYKMSSEDYRKMNIPGLAFDGEFGYLIGQPSRGFLALIYGASGHGKTTFSLRLANYLEHFGRVNYVTREQGGKSRAFQQLLNENDIKITQIDSELGVGQENMSEHMKGNGIEFDFIILDSVSYMKLTPDELEGFRKENKDVSVIGIMQCTKDGQMRGSQEFVHNADIQIKVENFMAKSEKNRFTGSKPAEIPTKPDSKPQVIV